ncbi:unnamed protein product [Toxocara canis]|uniref:MIF4G domain-containing protein n=1 Tax=Toxocara canis TaxID=6265 RepID=A0A183UTB7_TOXCA|nr:unnamed protein product [Toxocara canis]
MSELSVKTIEEWKTLSSESLQNELEKVTTEFATKFEFSHIDVETRKALCNLFSECFCGSPSALRRLIICFIRILARDKQNIGQLLSEELSKLIIRSALLSDADFSFNWEGLCFCFSL